MSARRQTSLVHRLITIFVPHRHNSYRPWIGRIPGLFAVTALLVGLHIALNGIDSQFLTINPITEQTESTELLNEVNSRRQKLGRAPLNIDQRLSQAAKAKAEHMMSNQYWAHVAPDGTEAWNFIQKEKYIYEATAENLARGFRNPSGAVAGWESSPPHREAMLNHTYSEVGFGVVKGNLLGEDTTVVVGLFARPLSGAAVSTGEHNKKTLALQGSSAELVTDADAVEFSLINPVSLHSTLTLPGKIAIGVLVALAVMYVVQHFLLRYKKVHWHPKAHEHPIVRLLLVVAVILLIIATSFGSIQ